MVHISFSFIGSVVNTIDIMGVRYLNNFISNRCRSALTHRHLRDYMGRTIAVDTSIYMYKYLGENTLMESMYYMMVQFQFYKITPIFVFDGAAPLEKQTALRSREANKATAELKYNQTAEQLQTLLMVRQERHSQDRPEQEDKNSADIALSHESEDRENSRAILEHERVMRGLRKRFIRVHGYELSGVKRLMRAFDMRYVEANGEADIMCAQIVKYGIAHACMSDDMDMFLYGCPRVLRYANLVNGTCVEYDLHQILKLLGISLNGLRKICILSGTDYNLDNFEPCMRCRIFLSDIYEAYIDFESSLSPSSDADTDAHASTEYDAVVVDGTAFYEWMKRTNWLFHHIDAPSLWHVFGLFSAEITSDQLLNLNDVLSKTISPTSVCEEGCDDLSPQPALPFEISSRVKKIMAQYNFIFI